MNSEPKDAARPAAADRAVPFAAWVQGLTTMVVGPYSDIRTRQVIAPGPEEIGRVAPYWRLSA